MSKLTELPPEFKPDNRLEIFKIFYNLELPANLPVVSLEKDLPEQEIRGIMSQYYTRLAETNPRLRSVFSFSGNIYDQSVDPQLKEDFINLENAIKLLGFRIAKEILEKSRLDLKSNKAIARKIVHAVVESTYKITHQH